MLNIQANAAVSEQQNCSNSMLKLARDLKLDRWIAFDLLYTLSPTSFLLLYKWKFSNAEHHLVDKGALAARVLKLYKKQQKATLLDNLYSPMWYWLVYYYLYVREAFLLS